MTDSILPLTHATERDVDLILIEELIASRPFAEWLANKGLADLRPNDLTGAHEVTHSRRRIHNRREIDIMLSFRQADGLPIVLLIENKLDTSEQPQQAESYKAAADELIATGRASRVATILIAPTQYLSQHHKFAGKFDRQVGYEELREHFAARAGTTSGELALRLRHRQALIDQAITKARRGYEAVPLAPIADFSAAYVRLLRDRYPNLIPGPSMLKSKLPGESKTMIFAPAALPNVEGWPQMRLVHQLREGNVNVNFYGWGDRFVDLAETMGRGLGGTGYKLVPSVNKRVGGRSGLMIVASSPPVDNLRPFDEQIENVLAGMAKADQLRSWIWDNQDRITGWAALVQPT